MSVKVPPDQAPRMTSAFESGADMRMSLGLPSRVVFASCSNQVAGASNANVSEHWAVLSSDGGPAAGGGTQSLHRVSGWRPDQAVSGDRSAAICLTDKLLAVLCVVWDHPRGAGKQRPRLHKEPSEGDVLMTRTDEASEATPRRPRKKVVNFAKRRTLRFSDDEERAVEDVRRALAASSRRELEEVTFSEALRLLITDKEGVAEIEARAQAIAGGTPDASAWSLADISDRLGYELGPMRNHIAHIGGNLNQVVKRLNRGDQVTSAELSVALDAVASLRDVPDDIEKRIASLVDRGLPPRGGA